MLHMRFDSSPSNTLQVLCDYVDNFTTYYLGMKLAPFFRLSPHAGQWLSLARMLPITFLQGLLIRTLAEIEGSCNSPLNGLLFK